MKAGEFFLGYTTTRAAAPPPLPQPELLSRNGSYLAYLRMEEHVGAFRDFLRQQSETPDQQELLAAKLMGEVAQRRAAGALPGRRRPGAGRRSAADKRFPGTRRPTRTVIAVRSAPTSAA